MMKKRLAWIALNKLTGIGHATIYHLVEKLNGPEVILEHSIRELCAISKLKKERLDSGQWSSWQTIAEMELEKARRYNCRIVTIDDFDYPVLLKKVHCPPPVLYIRGAIEDADSQAFAVVGSRRPSAYGLKTTMDLVRYLVRNNVTIVSGLAYGVDAKAHETALSENGRTLAVVAHGLDTLYPKAHIGLQKKIEAQGAVVSEFPFGVSSKPDHFPRRNRIISGLSLGTLVTEAGERSGALITARFAGEQGRDVFAVPGPYSAALSKGCHALIKDGATLITSGEDVLTELQVEMQELDRPEVPVKATILSELTDHEKQLVDLLKKDDCHVNELADRSGQDMAQLLSYLLVLEMKGVVQVKPGQIYQCVV